MNDLGDKSFFMLRNHGLITVADNVPDAFLLLYLFEAACTIQVRAQGSGGELINVDPRIIAGAQAQSKAVTAARAARWRGPHCCVVSIVATRPTRTEARSDTARVSAPHADHAALTRRLRETNVCAT